MKNIVAYIAFILLFASACKKHDSSPAGTTSYGYWTIGNRTFTATQILDSAHDDIQFASAGDTSGVAVNFGMGIPTASGSYPINNQTSGMSVSVTYPSQYINGNTNQYCTVTDSAGKIAFTVPAIWIHNTGNPNDSVQFSCYVYKSN